MSRPVLTPAVSTWTEVRSLGNYRLRAVKSNGTLIASWGNGLYQSSDEGATWTSIPYDPGIQVNFPDPIINAILLNDGNLLVCTWFNREIYRSNDPAWDSGFSTVLTLESDPARIDSYWGANVYHAQVLLGEYNTDNEPKAYRSMDNGLTWVKIFTAPDRTVPPNHHIHHVAYDPYDDITWIVVGDSGNRMIYFSYGDGPFRRFRAYGELSYNFIQIVPLPERILFQTDSAVQVGMYSLRRREGMWAEYVDLVLDWNLGAAVGSSPVGSMPIYSYGVDAKAYLGWFYFDPADNALCNLYGTYTGSVYTAICAPAIPPAGGPGITLGITSIFGPTLAGNLYTQYSRGTDGYFLIRVPEPIWS